MERKAALALRACCRSGVTSTFESWHSNGATISCKCTCCPGEASAEMAPVRLTCGLLLLLPPLRRSHCQTSAAAAAASARAAGRGMASLRAAQSWGLRALHGAWDCALVPASRPPPSPALPLAGRSLPHTARTQPPYRGGSAGGEDVGTTATAGSWAAGLLQAVTSARCLAGRLLAPAAAALTLLQGCCRHAGPLWRVSR